MRCVMCGTAPWEWDPTEGGNRHAYEAVESMCHGCYTKAAGQNHDPNRNTDGITVELVPTGTPEHARRLIKQRTRAMEKA